MDKSQLHKIFSKPFRNNDWLEVLQNAFGAKQLLTQPREILLPSNDKAKAAFELGNFTTSDDRIIGLYRIVLNPDVWLERNKVGLRELLRNIYKYDVDGAIIVFDQGEKWRLSFVSEIKVLNDEGEVIEQATEPKRYTYLLGQDEKVKTPSERLSKLAGKPLALNDILEAFSVEALNEEFYKIVAEYFYQLIGGKIGKGKKGKDYGDGILQLPSVPKENHQVYQEFTVRLIGRTVFCWFLKMKKGDNEESLLPEKLLSSKAVKDNSEYYHSVLERLFFQTLNTRMSERVDNLPEGCEQIPFLNGGLFEPGSDDYYRANRITGLSENLNTLKIEDKWFLNFFQELEKYNFTIDENSVTDVEVSVDPEMLGRIFENLLAEIDPDSGETARKATGSFYTPREIVDYMATESLVQYLHNKTALKPEILRPVFKMTEQEQPTFSDIDLESILDALDKVKILDPACGSGAFPMGVLQKIVMILQKLDPNAEWWKKRQLKRITNPIIKKALREKLDASSVEYARKIGIIQNSLYGVDIQPIAAEISKLRCFLTLIVDENIDDSKDNRGIEPLPNLEFKFVTADTLMELPEQKEQRTMFDNFEEMELLKELREEYLQSSGKKKEKIKERFVKVQSKMFKNEMHLFSDTQSRAYKLSSWNPFSHDKADWFDPKWMYGVDSFDVVIGNPPYVNLANIENKEYREFLKSTFSVAKNKSDLYSFFVERSNDFLKESGLLYFIISNSWMGTDSFSNFRKYLIERTKVLELVKCHNNVFNASVTPVILGLEKSICIDNSIKISELIDTRIIANDEILKYETIRSYKSLPFTFQKLLSFSIEAISLNHIAKFSLGIKTSNDKRFIGDDEFEDSSYRLIRGKDVERYKINYSNKWIWYKPNLMKEKKGAGPRNLEYFLIDKKIVIKDVANRIEAAIDDCKYLTNDTLSIIYHIDLFLLEFVLAILNSKTINYWYKSIYSTGLHIKLNELREIPIPNISNDKQLIFSFLVQYVTFTRSLTHDNQINPHVPNSHLVQLFEEVIDAMVMELYFENEFKNVGIEFIKYAELDFKSIEQLKTEEEKVEVIHQAYQTLRKKDSEIRNNLKLMDIKLADIVMPIKTAK